MLQWFFVFYSYLSIDIAITGGGRPKPTYFLVYVKDDNLKQIMQNQNYSLFVVKFMQVLMEEWYFVSSFHTSGHWMVSH